ncbi:unnamed protein product [Cylindrotheca closterium]|uniref:C2H2-type domain-containing protein n=1 Tax=Cylindrotheca closterium TaxID=2856 RepID=A0AAD2FIH9_9STRA|nr:unnamed protein product [Cylindrotheca closterium]
MSSLGFLDDLYEQLQRDPDTDEDSDEDSDDYGHSMDYRGKRPKAYTNHRGYGISYQNNSYRDLGYTDRYGDYHWDSDAADSDAEDDYLDRDVQFYRPDGSYEGKAPRWCLDNGFFRVAPGVWSGRWYWEHFPEELENREKDRATRHLAKEKRRQEKEAWERRDFENERRDLDGLLPPRLHKCLLKGCNEHFPSIEERDHHVRSHPGNGHARYREQHNIYPTIEELMGFMPPTSTRGNDAFRSGFDFLDNLGVQPPISTRGKDSYQSADDALLDQLKHDLRVMGVRCDLDSDDYDHGGDDYDYRDKFGARRAWDNWHDDVEEEDDIDFYRPDGTYECKSPQWCRDHGFFQVGETEWSGKWYYEQFPERKEQWEKERVEIQREKEKWAVEMEAAEERALEYERREIEELLALERDGRDMDDFLMPRRSDCNHLCLLQGCSEQFYSIEERDYHVRFHQGKGHERYREQYGICQTTNGPIFVPNPSSPPPVQCKQTDIRSFFAPATGR